MTIATMARMRKKIIKMTAMTMFRFVIFWGRGGGGGRGEADGRFELQIRAGRGAGIGW